MKSKDMFNVEIGDDQQSTSSLEKMSKRALTAETVASFTLALLLFLATISLIFLGLKRGTFSQLPCVSRVALFGYTFYSFSALCLFLSLSFIDID